jgi:hypothetical protein
MDMPNFKDIVQKLSVFKNNLSLLVPVIIGLVSVLLFIPTQLMSSKLRRQVEQESISKGVRSIQSLEGKAVSREQYQREAERQKAHANDANEIAALAEQNTQRELLSYDIFPEPNGSSTLVFQEFGKRFRDAMDELIVRANGGDCPTDAELERALEDSSAVSNKRRSSAYSRGPSMPYSRGPSAAYSRKPTRSSSRDSRSSRVLPGMFRSEIERMIVDQVCTERAASISVYVNSADLSGYDYWGDYKQDIVIKEAVEDCWYHQLAYWVIEDVFDTIAAMNSEYDNVLTAPVKRFLRISFTMGLKRPRASSGVYRGIRGRGRRTKKDNDEADKPSYVLSVSDGLTESCTGRFSNDDIDVIHFNVAVVVSTKSVLPFMQQLCSAKEHKFSGYDLEALEKPETFKHNQISILEDKVVSVNPEEMAHRYYSYGEDSTVELDLICEYIFNKIGYEKIKPESVKKTLAGEDETTGQ